MKNLSQIFLVWGLGCSIWGYCLRNGISAENTQTDIIKNSVQPNKNELEPAVDFKRENLTLKLGESEFQAIVNRGKTLKPVYFNMHDDENTSVEAAKWVADKVGGTVIELKHSGDRLINFRLKNKSYKIDPNRIFTSVGISKTLKKYGGTSPEAEAEVDKFAKKLIADFLKQTDVVIALHNNTNNQYSAKSYEKGGEFEKDAAQVFIDPANDIDDFFFVTEEKHFDKIKEKGFNVVLQDNRNVTDDGSLSVYCGNEKITYINIEAEHGHRAEQIKMLEALREILAN